MSLGRPSPQPSPRSTRERELVRDRDMNDERQFSAIAPTASRREFLARAGAGFGGVALSAMLASQARAGGGLRPPAALVDPTNPLTPRLPHFAPRAKNVIFLF